MQDSNAQSNNDISTPYSPEAKMNGRLTFNFSLPHYLALLLRALEMIVHITIRFIIVYEALL